MRMIIGRVNGVYNITNREGVGMIWMKKRNAFRWD